MSLANRPSTALAQEQEVGVKWKVKRECRASQAAADELVAQPRWTCFIAWADLVFSDRGRVTNSVQQIEDLYNAANVITRDQLPGWG